MVINVIGPFVLAERQRAEDKAADDEGEQSDANETPEVEQALLEEGSEACRSCGLVTVEGSRDEKEVDDKKDGDRCMTGDSASVSYGAFVKVQEDFAYGAEIEAAGETLRGEE